MQLNALFDFLGKSFVSQGDEAAKASASDPAENGSGFGALLAAAFGFVSQDAGRSTPAAPGAGDGEASTGTDSAGLHDTGGDRDSGGGVANEASYSEGSDVLARGGSEEHLAGDSKNASASVPADAALVAARRSATTPGAETELEATSESIVEAGDDARFTHDTTLRGYTSLQGSAEHGPSPEGTPASRGAPEAAPIPWSIKSAIEGSVEDSSNGGDVLGEEAPTHPDPSTKATGSRAGDHGIRATSDENQPPSHSRTDGPSVTSASSGEPASADRTEARTAISAAHEPTTTTRASDLLPTPEAARRTTTSQLTQQGPVPTSRPSDTSSGLATSADARSLSQTGPTGHTPGAVPGTDAPSDAVRSTSAPNGGTDAPSAPGGHGVGSRAGGVDREVTGEAHPSTGARIGDDPSARHRPPAQTTVSTSPDAHAPGNGHETTDRARSADAGQGRGAGPTEAGTGTVRDGSHPASSMGTPESDLHTETHPRAGRAGRDRVDAGTIRTSGGHTSGGDASGTDTSWHGTEVEASRAPEDPGSRRHTSREDRTAGSAHSLSSNQDGQSFSGSRSDTFTGSGHQNPRGADDPSEIARALPDSEAGVPSVDEKLSDSGPSTEETAFTPEQRTTTPGLTAPDAATGSVRARTPGTVAWLRSMLAQSAGSMSLDGGWKTIEVQLEDGQGTMIVRARRGDDGVSVSVTFSDPSLRALAEANADRLQDALRAEYESNVDLSLASDGSSDTPGRRDPSETDHLRSRGRAAPETAAEPAAGPLPRPALTGAGNEWIG